jgi:hypothetical protein
MNRTFLSSSVRSTLALCVALGGAALAQERASITTTTANVGVQTATPTSTPAQATQKPPTPEPRPQEGSGIDPKKAQTGPAPRLESDASDHDFGTAIQGEKLSHTFKLKSAGQADLVITAAKPTCGCTVAKLEVKKADGSSEVYKFGDPLAPGTELSLLAELDTKNKTNQAQSKINVYCNDPRTIVTLGLSARVDTYFQITPAAVTFGDLSIADTVEKSFTVAGKKPGNFLLSLEQKTLPDGMKIDIKPKDPDAGGKANIWEVKVTVGPNAREGNLGYPISLHSDEAVAGGTPDKDGKAPTYGASVMVTARVMGLISFEPQYLSFGLVRPGQVVARSLTLKSFDPNFSFGECKVKLIGPSDQKPDFQYGSSFSNTVKVAEDKKSAVVELTLNGLPETLDGSFQGRMVITTGHPQKPEVQVLFSGVCRAGVKTAAPPTPTPNPAPTPPAGGEQKKGGGQ